jgi:Domain of unknown function (DUF222)/HNH endonuclease
MCVAGQPAAPAAPPLSTGQALAALHSALAYLATADPTALTTAEQANCLRSLERAESVRTAAQAAVLSAFSAGCGFEDDGHGSARSWLRWQARITGPAASAAMAWTRRLNAHRAVASALAAAQISASWARQICDWTDVLPPAARGDADTILLAAAAAGAELADLAGLAEEMRNRTAPPDQDGDDDGAGRSLRLDLHYRGHGHLRGDLTPRCAAALAAILDALGKKTGPEDTRTRAQRYHDALEEGCRRLIAAATVPDRAGQPTQIQLLLTLSDLLNPPPGHGTPPAASSPPGYGDQPGHRDPPGHSDPPGHRDPPGHGDPPGDTTPSDVRKREHLARILGLQPFNLTGPAPSGWTGPGPRATPGDLCDATIIPVVTGHVDHDLLDQLATNLLGHASPAPGTPLGPAYAREVILRTAVALLSGPAGLASRLRTSRLTGPAASISLPLDVGTATDTIPPHLRRAVIRRDLHCAFPGCDQPPAACQVHHIIPRSQGGPTSLTNLLLTCTFHHLVAIHQWGWTVILNADGAKTAISPDRTRTLHSHGPPDAA